MKFFRVRIRYDDFPNLLNRLLLIREDITLKEAGRVFAALLKARDFQGSLFLGDRKETLYKDPDSDFTLPEATKTVDQSAVFLKDALEENNRLRFLYDPKAFYLFTITLSSKKTFALPIRTDAILLEAKGDGIFEEDREGLDAFLEEGVKGYYEVHPEKDLPKNYDYNPEFDLDDINLKLAVEENPIFENWSRPKEKVPRKKVHKKRTPVVIS